MVSLPMRIWLLTFDIRLPMTAIFPQRLKTILPLLEERAPCSAGASSLVVLTAGVRSNNYSQSLISLMK